MSYIMKFGTTSVKSSNRVPSSLRSMLDTEQFAALLQKLSPEELSYVAQQVHAQASSEANDNV